MGRLSGFEHCTRENEPLAPHTWFRLGGPVEYFIEPTSVEELGALVLRCREQQVPIRLLGGGSNILVPSEGLTGVVASISAPAFVAIQLERNVLKVGAGARLSHLISTAVREGLAGLEPLVGIPGTVGGALHGNAASLGIDVGQWCREATVMTRTGEIVTRGPEDLRFAYRQSSLDELAILAARFELEPEDRAELTRRMQKMWIVKSSTQPSSEMGCGCIFKDPQGMSASELIDEAGLAGSRIGAAQISERNPNFIVAEPGASSDDVKELIELVRGRVSVSCGVELENQIEIW